MKTLKNQLETQLKQTCEDQKRSLFVENQCKIDAETTIKYAICGEIAENCISFALNSVKNRTISSLNQRLTETNELFSVLQTELFTVKSVEKALKRASKSLQKGFPPIFDGNTSEKRRNKSFSHLSPSIRSQKALLSTQMTEIQHKSDQLSKKFSQLESRKAAIQAKEAHISVCRLELDSVAHQLTVQSYSLHSYERRLAHQAAVLRTILTRLLAYPPIDGQQTEVVRGFLDELTVDRLPS